MKKKLKKNACLLCLLGLTITGCSIRGVTEPFDQPNDNIENITEKHTLPSDNTTSQSENKETESNKSDNDAMDIDEEKYGKVKYQVGEEMPALAQRGPKASDLEKYMSITVTEKNIYRGLEEAGIKKEDCKDHCEIYPQFDEIPLTLKVEQYKDAKILILNVHIEVEDWYINEKDTYKTITYWKLSYVKENGEYVYLGNPCFFSEGTEGHYYGMELSKKNFDVKVGYIIDESLLKVDEIDLSKLIYNVNGYGPTFKYMELFPEGN